MQPKGPETDEALYARRLCLHPRQYIRAPTGTYRADGYGIRLLASFPWRTQHQTRGSWLLSIVRWCVWLRWFIVVVTRCGSETGARRLQRTCAFVLLLLGRKTSRLGWLSTEPGEKKKEIMLMDLRKKGRAGNPAHMRLQVLNFISYPVGSPCSASGRYAGRASCTRYGVRPAMQRTDQDTLSHLMAAAVAGT